MAERFVLDAWALLAVFQAEPAAMRVRELLTEATSDQPLYLTTVNLGEVLYNLERRRGSQVREAALAAIDALPLQIIDVHRTLALRASGLKASTHLGYADCFASALAQTLDATVLTGDSGFSGVEGIVRVEWLTRS